MDKSLSEILNKLTAALLKLLGWTHTQEAKDLIDHANNAEPKPAHLSKIETWARAIQHAEGGRTYDRNTRNKNPGNLKFTSYTKSLGAVSHDDKNFCVFPTYQDGFKALCTFLEDAASGKLMAYRPAMALRLFTQIYAEPPSSAYVTYVAHELGVSVDTPISSLL